MAYDPTTDFVGLWRAVAGGVEKGELPGLDFWVAAMGRAGLINVVVSGIAPTSNQDTTAWFQTATPSYAAEGALYLWDADLSAYVPATPALFSVFLTVSSGSPGISALLDLLGSTQGDILYRGASSWTVLAPGVLGQNLQTGGPAANPAWATAVLLPPNRFTSITPGAHVFTATVTGWHRFTLNGAGGGAGGAQNVSYAAGGGGGGQVVDYAFLTLGVGYNYVVGSNGVGGTTSGTDGTDGGDTTFTGPGGTVIAEGGGGGEGATGGGTGLMGGAGGFGSGFSANGYALRGGVGYQGIPQILSGGQGGFGAGFGAQGGPGGGNVGAAPGGAGGGAAGGAGAQAGGDGADGQFIIEF